MAKFDFITTGNTASLLLHGQPVIHNLDKTELFKLFAATENAINQVEEMERNSREFGVPVFESCLSE